MIELDPAAMPPRDVYGLLIGAIAPRPIAFVSTLSADGIPNLAPFSFFNGGGSDPPSVVFSPVHSREGRPKDTLTNIETTGEYVINVVTWEMAEQMNIASADFPPEVNEFAEAGFTPAPARKVKPARVAESPIAFECRLHQIVRHGSAPLSANYVIGEVVYAWVEERVWRDGRIYPPAVHAIGRMGGAWYCRTDEAALFEMARPGR